MPQRIWFILAIILIMITACGQSTIPPLAEPNKPTVVLIYTKP